MGPNALDEPSAPRRPEATSPANGPGSPRTPEAASRLLDPALGRLVRAFNPERIVMFGSYAKGTAQAGSDIDLLVVAEVEGEPQAHLRRARELVADSFPPIDVVLCTPAEIDEAPRARSPFLASVLGRGITVYARAPAGDREGNADS